MTRHARAARLGASLGEHYRDLPRRRAGDRRPDRAQPRHDRRVAVPGRSVRGPVGRVRRSRGDGGDPRRRRGRAPCRCASSTSARTRPSSARPRCSPRSECRSARVPAAPTRRSSGAPATGRSRPRALRLDRRRHVSRRRHRPHRRRRRSTSAPPRPRPPCVGQAADRGELRRRGRLAAEHCNPQADQRGPADYKRHLASELTRASAAPRPSRREPTSEGHDDASDDDGQRRGGHAARSSRGCCSCTSSATISA